MISYRYRIKGKRNLYLNAQGGGDSAGFSGKDFRFRGMGKEEEGSGSFGLKIRHNHTDAVLRKGGVF